MTNQSKVIIFLNWPFWRAWCIVHVYKSKLRFWYIYNQGTTGETKNKQGLTSIVIFLKNPMEAHVHTTFFMNNGDVWLVLWSMCVTMSKQDYLKIFDMSKLFSIFFQDSMIHHFQNTSSWLRVLLPNDYPKNQIMINFLYEHVWQLCTKTLKIN